MVRSARMKRPSRAVRVGPASCGQGVFARRSFQAKETIAQVRGQVIADDDYWSPYCIDLGLGEVLEPAAPFRFLNHSCRPNCTLIGASDWDEDSGLRRHSTRLQALTAIEPGDELTIDYAWPPCCAIPCLCGSENCRGWIVDQRQLELLQDN